MATETKTEMRRVYAACLRSYNAGNLHGRWIDADDAETMREEITAMLAESPSPGEEEYAIYDYDGFPSAIGDALGEHPDLDAVALHAGMLDKHGDAWSVFVGWQGIDFATEDGFDESYQGQYDNPGDYAAEYLEETGSLSGLPETLRGYFDEEAMERDMELSGDIYRSDDGHVFLSL